MTTNHRPVRTTLIFGGLGGLVCCLAGWAGAWPVFWPWFPFGLVWCLIAVYALVLLRWSGRSLPAVFSRCWCWRGSVRSCRRQGWLSAWHWLFSAGFAAASVFRGRRSCPWCVSSSCVAAAACLMLGPVDAVSWGLGIWFFSLVQALFFVLFEPGRPPSETRRRTPSIRPCVASRKFWTGIEHRGDKACQRGVSFAS